MGFFHIPLMVLLDPPVVCTHYHIILRLLRTYLVNISKLNAFTLSCGHSKLLVSVMTLVASVPTGESTIGAAPLCVVRVL